LIGYFNFKSYTWKVSEKGVETEMKKFYFTLLLLLITMVSNAQYQIMGYFRNSAYGDYVIVYGYYDSNGNFQVSHCRTNAINNIYSNLAYLDINTCTIKIITPAGAPTTPALPAPAAPTVEKAFF
jgi:hypothetical protein